MDFKRWILEEEGFASASLYGEMAIQSQTALQRIGQALQFVHGHQLNCVLIGGMAVAHYTHRSITPDVDFMCDNMQAVRQALEAEGLSYARLASPGVEGLQAPDFMADFLDANTGNTLLNQYVIKTATTALIGGFTVRIIAPEILAIQKLEAGRNKDLDDAFKLLPLADLAKLRKHLRYLGRSLTLVDAKTIWQYATTLRR